MPYYYHLGPYREVMQDGAVAYRPPEQCVAAVDLASLAELSQRPRGGVGFFACETPLDSTFVALNDAPGDCRELRADAVMRAAWQAATGVEAAGDTLIDLLWNHLTAGSDPLGQERARPLMPTTHRRLELHLPGHAPARSSQFSTISQPFRFGRHPQTQQVQAVLQADYQRMHETPGREQHARRVLDFWKYKYGLAGDDVMQLVPPALRESHPGPLPHATVYSDDFNRPDEPLDSSPNWSIAGVVGASVVDEQVLVHSGSPPYRLRNRFEPLLSSEDHYAELAAADLSSSTTTAVHVIARLSPDGQDFYVGRIARAGAGGAEHSFTLQKVIGGHNGTLTALATVFFASAVATPFTCRIAVDGSTLRLFRNAEEVLAATDTAITGHVQTGLAGASGDAYADDWQTANLPLTARHNPFAHTGYGPIGSKRIRGLMANG